MYFLRHSLDQNLEANIFKSLTLKLNAITQSINFTYK